MKKKGEIKKEIQTTSRYIKSIFILVQRSVCRFYLGIAYSKGREKKQKERERKIKNK
jgi:hypothetical protein